MLAAGHETSATSLAWALYHIHRDENVRGRVLEEPSGVATAQEMAGLPYLGSVIKETLRAVPRGIATKPSREVLLTVTGRR